MAAKAQTTQFSFLWDRCKLGKIKINLLLTVEVLFSVTRFKRSLHYYGKFPNYPWGKPYLIYDCLYIEPDANKGNLLFSIQKIPT